MTSHLGHELPHAVQQKHGRTPFPWNHRGDRFGVQLAKLRWSIRTMSGRDAR